MVWLRTVQKQVSVVSGLFDGTGVQCIAVFPHLFVIGVGGQCSCPGVWRLIALWAGCDPEEVGCRDKCERDVQASLDQWSVLKTTRQAQFD